MDNRRHGTRRGRAWTGSGLVLALLLAALGAEQKPAAGQDGYAGGGAAVCLDCHDARGDVPAHEILRTPHALQADPRTPFAAGQNACETCHGPSQAHLTRRPDGTRPPPGRVFTRLTPAAEKSAVCLDCHQGGARVHWPGSTHAFEEVACTDCHRVHEERDPVLQIATQPAICFDCHQAERAQLLRPSRHPVQVTGMTSRIGMLACTDCHNPHGSAGPRLLVRFTVNETCYDCHAEKRGPFLFDHPPVREDCTTCHTPHGSVHANLLKARAPWLCQECHMAERHPSTAYSGTGVPPLGAAQQLLARSCLNCHTQVHGSNHPSGIRFTR